MDQNKTVKALKAFLFINKSKEISVVIYQQNWNEGGIFFAFGCFFLLEKQNES